MKLQKRLWPLLFMGIALTAIIILSAGINDLEFLPGSHFKIRFEPVDTAGEAVADTDDYALTLYRILLVGWLVCIPVAFFLISPQKRKQALLFFVLLFFMLVFSDRIIVYLLGGMRNALQLPTEMLLSLPGRDFGGLIMQFTPSAPQWFTLIVSTGVALLIVIAAFFLVRRFFTHRSPPTGPMRNAAQDAIEALRGGADLKDTVVHCYREMGQVLMKKRGITRTKDMTPREFERSLLPSSLPHEALYQLTRLFEEIRYGNKAPGEKESRNAVRCLTAIIKACETES
jgi:hypothetical protein